MSKFDFSGYATKNDLKCSDGRIIRRDAFKDNDGSVVPLVWQHLHDEPTNVLGHALLENRSDGVYAYCTFNESEQAQHAKILVKHGDITSMSIYANRLSQNGPNVMHGVIREVSLVLAAANPGARIQNLSFTHSDGTEEEFDDEALIYADQLINTLAHAKEDEDEEVVEEVESESNSSEENQNGSGEGETMADGDKTVEDVFNELTDEQKDVVYYLIGQAVEDAQGGEVDETVEIDEEEEMKHNVFDAEDDFENVLSHSEMEVIIGDAKRIGSMKEAFLEHGIENIDVLFPEAKLVTPTPEMIMRPNDWVSEVWNGVKKSPFSRIKSTAANIKGDEARAKGYVKGKKKVEEVVKLLKRVTTPQTVYKLQKMDRDDVIDITDIDVIAWLKAEMRIMLDEEIARAILVGDGRDDSSDDKIKSENIRPIYGDSDVYVIYKDITLPKDETDRSNVLIDAALRARKDYMGSGNPTFYGSTDIINDMLLAKDKIGRRLYSTVTELADALRVSKIVEVPVLENITREDDKENTKNLLGLIVNLSDYTVGADKGGEVNMFDDFDIDYNKYEYLIETRCSGSLIKPYSAIALETSSIEVITPGTPSTPDTPSEDEDDDKIAG